MLVVLLFVFTMKYVHLEFTVEYGVKDPLDILFSQMTSRFYQGLFWSIFLFYDYLKCYLYQISNAYTPDTFDKSMWLYFFLSFLNCPPVS